MRTIVYTNAKRQEILGKASDPLRNALSAYAHDVGLAFQIADDLLDIEGTAAEIGKTPGKDAAARAGLALGRCGTRPGAGLARRSQRVRDGWWTRGAGRRSCGAIREPVSFAVDEA